MALSIYSNTRITASMTIGYVTTGTTVVTTTLPGLILEINPKNIIPGTFSDATTDTYNGFSTFLALIPDSSGHGNTASYRDIVNGFGNGNTNPGCDQFGDPVLNRIFVTGSIPYFNNTWSTSGSGGLIFASSSTISDLTASTWCAWIWIGKTGSYASNLISWGANWGKSILYTKDDYSQGSNGGYVITSHSDPANTSGTTWSGNIIRYWNLTTNTNASIASNTIPTGSWCHYVITSDAAGSYLTPNIQFYVNGVTVSKTGLSTNASGAHYSDAGMPLRFGNRGANALNAGFPSNFRGNFGLIQMYNRQLSQSEVLSLYQSQNNYPTIATTGNLVGYLAPTDHYQSGWVGTFSCDLPIYSRTHTLGQLAMSTTYYYDTTCTTPISGDNGRQMWAFSTQSGLPAVFTASGTGTASIVYNNSNATWPDLIGLQDDPNGFFNRNAPYGYWIQSNVKVTVPATNIFYIDASASLYGPPGGTYPNTIYAFPYIGQISWSNNSNGGFTAGLTYAWAVTAGSSASYLLSFKNIITDNQIYGPIYTITAV